MSAFFLVVRGERSEVAAWRQVAKSHGAALGLAAESVQWRLGSSVDLLVVVLDHPALRSGTSRNVAGTALGARDGGDLIELHTNTARPGTVTSVLIEPRTACVRVRVPFASPDQAYILHGSTASIVTNDLRLSVARHPPVLDPHGVYALLQYGAIPAPFTLFRGVERVRPGHEASLDTNRLTRLPEPTPVPDGATVDDAEAYVIARIDDVLLRERRPNAIFFSGGVDSGLLAARIAAAGIRDVPLLNYSFGKDDPEAAHAERMASHLGMALERIEDSPKKAVDVLERAARDYSYPFGDYSSLPMNLLVRASSAWLPAGSEVVDGTGADGVFALGFGVEGPILSRYWRLAWLPRWVGELAGRIHARAGLSAADGRFASAVRLVHRATTMPPLLAAVIAQNSLHSECFRADREVRAEVDRAVIQMVASLTPSTSVADLATILDVVHVCGGVFAAKDFDPFRHRGVDALYPYLHPEVLGPSLQLPWNARCADAEAKGLLKRALARHVPSALVYRRKSGFRPPVKRYFAEGEVRNFVQDHLLRRDSRLAGFLDSDRVDRLCSRAFSGEPIHRRGYNLLWALTFMSAWIDGLAQLRALVGPESGGVDTVDAMKRKPSALSFLE